MKPFFPFALLLIASVAQAQSWLSAPASYTCRVPVYAQRASYLEHLVKYNCTNITICGLIATTGAVQQANTCGDPQNYMFSDGPCSSYGTDLVAGAWGWATGATFSGTVTVPVSGITNNAGYMPVGYAVVGSTSGQVATVTLGPNTIYCTNSWDRTIAGAAGVTSISMCTTGWAKIGIIQMASNEWYGALDGVGDQTGFTDLTSVNTNAGWLSYSWTCTRTTNYVVMRWDKYGGILWQTNIYHLSHNGYIPAGSQLRIPATGMWSPAAQTWIMFGWRVIYGPRPSEAWFLQAEIDARAEYTKRGWGQ